MSDVILKATDLKKYYPIRKGVFRKTVGHVKAVNGVSFELRRGETLGIVGESGCGKSTLGRLLVQLEAPSEGQVEFEGKKVEFGSRAMRQLRRDIQIVFQDPYTSLNPRMTVGDIIAEPLYIHKKALGLKGKERQRVRELLDQVGLNPEHINRYPHQFSGGQRQRIGIARGIALNPKVLVCDEPVSALDVSVQAQVVNLLEQLQRDMGMAYIFIAHDLAVVRHISDRVAVMYLGQIVETGDSDQIYNHPMHPYTQALMSAAPVPDPLIQSQRERIMLSGDVPSPASPPPGCKFHTRCWKAQAICSTEIPCLTMVGAGQAAHEAACHFPEENTDVVA